MKAGYTRDKKTGRIRKINPVKSRIAKRAARRRRGKPLRANVKRNISRSVRKANRSGRTKFGRRLIKRKTPVRRKR